MKYISKSDLQTQKIGEDFALKLKGGDVVFLIGQLGAGKTTFAKGLAKGIGVKSRIMSPTFIIVREHEVAGNKEIKTLYHLDLYRLNSEKEVKNIDLHDILNDQEGIVVIEWPKVGQSLVNKKVWNVILEQDDETRSINISYE